MLASVLLATALSLPQADATPQPPPSMDEAGLAWARPPSVKDLVRHYPVSARTAGVRRGSAKVNCTARANGTLNCQVAEQWPETEQFGRAALAVMQPAKVKTVDGGSPEGRTFHFSVKFGAWAPSQRARVSRPAEGLAWVVAPTLDNWEGFGMARGETFSATADCIAGEAGQLRCELTEANPDSGTFKRHFLQGLADARVRSTDGAPLEGRRFSYSTRYTRS